jgi:nucleotide-binding universal stress UspA family protein
MRHLTLQEEPVLRRSENLSKPDCQRITFERILCPLDLSPDSEAALRYAIAVAQAFEARLTVCHCIDDHSFDHDPREISAELDTAVQRHLRLPREKLAFGWNTVVVQGEPAEAITREAAKRRVDLIAMRSRRRPHAAALLGSTAESVCRTAPCPVLVTHPAEREWAGMSTNEVGLERVLVAYDFSGDSELALAYALSMSQEYQAALHMLHVLPQRSRSSTPELASLGADNGFQLAAERLHHAVPPEAAMWCEIKEAVREGQVYREVLNYAEERNIDLICMGASGTGFGMRALFGSNADRVLRQAHCPVLIARPLKPAQGD